MKPTLKYYVTLVETVGALANAKLYYIPVHTKSELMELALIERAIRGTEFSILFEPIQTWAVNMMADIYGDERKEARGHFKVNKIKYDDNAISIFHDSGAFAIRKPA